MVEDKNYECRRQKNKKTLQRKTRFLNEGKLLSPCTKVRSHLVDQFTINN